MTLYGKHPASLYAMLLSFWCNRKLILRMTKRDVIGRYRGSLAGIAWSFFHPLLMLAVYTFVFSYVFKVRWGLGEEENGPTFAIVLFIGLIIHGIFAESITRAPTLILGNVSYVKKVVFPLEVLPWVAVGTALFHGLISFLVLLLAIIIFGPGIYWTTIYLPLIFLPFILVTMGIVWFLAAIGVYIRDINQITGVITTILLFLSPVFFKVSILPIALQKWIFLNPLTLIIEEARAVLIWGITPDFQALSIYSAISLLIFWLGFWWFQRTRKGFADVV